MTNARKTAADEIRKLKQENDLLKLQARDFNQLRTLDKQQWTKIIEDEKAKHKAEIESVKCHNDKVYSLFFERLICHFGLNREKFSPDMPIWDFSKLLLNQNPHFEGLKESHKYLKQKNKKLGNELEQLRALQDTSKMELYKQIKELTEKLNAIGHVAAESSTIKTKKRPGRVFVTIKK